MKIYYNWDMFTTHTENFYDIKITAETASGKKDVWYLNKDKQIGLFKINSKMSMNFFSFNYPGCVKNFFKDYLIESLKKFYKDKNEIFLYLKIEMILYSSFEDKETIELRLKPIKTEIDFEWFGVYNVNTGYL
jgi:hypothetical protein